MQNHELTILTINAIIILIAYFIIYPKYCGSNGNKIAVHDLIALCVVLFVSGSLFWGSGLEFSLFGFSPNWFWFCAITYALMETPFMLWYFKKHDVWSSFNDL